MSGQRALRGLFGGGDFQSFELLVASCVSLSVPVWSALLLSMSQLGEHAAAVAIAPAPQEINMKVKPVIDMDSPFLKLGGGKGKTIKLPKAWQKRVIPKTPPPDSKAPPNKAQVSTKADDTEEGITDAGVDTDLDAEAIDPDAAVGDDPDATTGAGGAPPEDDVPEGGGSAEGTTIGTETNPLKVNAKNKYRGRLLGFLYQGWRCPPAATGECTASAVVQLSGTTVTSVSFNGCGDAALDAAASAHANTKTGQSVPPPPEQYPEFLQPSWNITYQCTKKK